MSAGSNWNWECVLELNLVKISQSHFGDVMAMFASIVDF